MNLLIDLNRRLARDIRYIVRLEPGVYQPEETLDLRKGSCRDSGWLLVHLLDRSCISNSIATHPCTQRNQTNFVTC